jgi:hypothetical protein
MAAWYRVSHFLVALALGMGLTGFAALAQQVGVNSAVNPDATGTAPSASQRQLLVGQEVVHDERIATVPAGNRRSSSSTNRR